MYIKFKGKSMEANVKYDADVSIAVDVIYGNT
jgi:hypothetical protein